MKTLQQRLIEEFKEKFKHSVYCLENFHKGACLCDRSAYKDFLLHALSTYKDELRKRVEGKVKGPCYELDEKGVCGHWHGGEADYNTALTDVLAVIEEI